MAMVVTALFLVALILAGIELFRSKFGSLEAWAVFVLAVGLVVGRLS